MLIILQIWEQSVISPNYDVASLISPKEWSVNAIYPLIYYYLSANCFFCIFCVLVFIIYCSNTSIISSSIKIDIFL